ncbi:MAG: hypothetical protein EOP88_06285 [Verrucomicrobiaceae bacterium]|nr:MAG: hypothetical protein EOP88_06285 [Verrucomicrobiaceae bacterium]
MSARRTIWGRYRIALLFLLAAVFIWWTTGGRTAVSETPAHTNKISRSGDSPDPPERRQGHPPERIRHEVERIFSTSEAARSRVLSHKKSVESDLYLLGVEPPDEAEVKSIREKIAAQESRLSEDEREVFNEWLDQAVKEYDAFGEEGRRLIQIDVPDEPNGRLTGFTCPADDFDAHVRDFLNGEMMELRNVRGYAASFAGMPLDRFRKLISPDDTAPILPTE